MYGDVIRSFREHIDIIGHVHIADNPGRHEFGTGEINYRSVFEGVVESEYDSFVGFEFTPTEGSNPERILEKAASLR